MLRCLVHIIVLLSLWLAPGVGWCNSFYPGALPEIYAEPGDTLSGLLSRIALFYGSNRASLVIGVPIRVGIASSIPSNLTVLFHGGGSLDCENQASVLTINGPLVAPPAQQIFVNCASTGVLTTSAFESGAEVFPEWWGAVANTKTLSNGSIQSGSPTLTTATAQFNAADIGKLITVKAAGVAGAVLVTTVASFNSPTDVTLSDSASTTVSANGIINVGADNSIPLQAALNFAKSANSTAHLLSGFSGLRGYMYLTPLSVASASRGFRIYCEPGAFLNYAGASGYAFTLTNSTQVRMDLRVEVLTTTASGVAIEQSGTGDSIYNQITGTIQGVGIAAAKPALGVGTVGLHIKHSGTIAKANYANQIYFIRVNRFDNGILLDGAAGGGNGSNANNIIHPNLDRHWYGMMVLSDENSITGGYCYVAHGNSAGLGNSTECIHLGDAANDIQAIYNEILGMTMEPETNSYPLVVESGSIENTIIVTDNTTNAPVISEPNNQILTRTISKTTRLVDTPPACAAGLQGAQYFDLSLNEMCFCNATNWCKVSAPATCTSPTSCG